MTDGCTCAAVVHQKLMQEESCHVTHPGHCVHCVINYANDAHEPSHARVVHTSTRSLQATLNLLTLQQTVCCIHHSVTSTWSALSTDLVRGVESCTPRQSIPGINARFDLTWGKRDGVLATLSVWSKVLTCIWPS